MGKKEESKAAAKAAKKEKQKTKAEKKKRKEFGVDAEDIEKIVANVKTEKLNFLNSFVTLCEQPSARAHASLTLLPNNEVFMFGGEYFNGQKSICFNDVYKWNIEKSEWKKVECPVSPKPRCSHQAVFHKDSIYIFGGEFSAMDQFYHFKDFWKFDLKTNSWRELHPNGDVPSPRSGHRMVVWRNMLLLFGGFCDTYRETKYFNDLYLYDFQENKWSAIVYSKTADVPEMRSACCFLTTQHNTDFIFMYGGFAKTKDNGRTLQGKTYHDSWLLNMHPCISNKNASPIWQRIRKTGNYPSIRSGASMVAFKHLAIMFGGVYDEDPGKITMKSVFYNDVYAFDLNRRRWYAFDLKEEVEKERKKTKNKARKEGIADHHNNNNEEKESDEDSFIESQANYCSRSYDSFNRNEDDETYDYQENTFGYIDENGKLVRIKIIDSNQKNVLPYLPDDIINSDTKLQSENVQGTEFTCREEEVENVRECISRLEVSSHRNMLSDVKNDNRIDVSIDKKSMDTRYTAVDIDIERSSNITGVIKKHKVPYSINSDNEINNESARQNVKKRKKDKLSTIKYEKVEITNCSTKSIGDNSISKDELIKSNDVPNSNVKNEISNKSSFVLMRGIIQADELPLPRINPHLFVINNKLFIYGGLVEIGRKEVTLDDCWAINLVKREKWEKVLAGHMDQQMWIESETDGEEGEKGSSDNDNCSETSDEDSKSSTSENISSDDSLDELRIMNKKTNSKNFREVLNRLKEKYDMENTNITPIINETLKDFFNRTQESWILCVENPLDDKKTQKREAFAAAETRYNIIKKIYKKYGSMMVEDEDKNAKKFK